MLKVTAPAKINLTLEVLRKRPDGFHEIRSILQTISLADEIEIHEVPTASFQCDLPEWSAEKSLMSKVLTLLNVKKGVSVKITKRIPLVSGLGGDSSDAAALLKALNALWDLKLTDEKLKEIVAQLGSDVPFFLKGGMALAAGRGEILKPLPSFSPLWLVLVMPDVPAEVGKTGRMYASLKPVHFTDGTITQKVADATNKGEPFKPAMLFNTFENVAFEDYNIRQIYVEHLIKMGALHVHLAGSGPTLFTMFPDKSRAEDFFDKCRKQGMKTYLAQTL